MYVYLCAHVSPYVNNMCLQKPEVVGFLAARVAGNGEMMTDPSVYGKYKLDSID